MKTLLLTLIISISLLAQQNPFSDQSAGLNLSPLYYGNFGVSVVDYDKDGWDDIFFSNIAHTVNNDTTYCVLLRNNRNGTFTNVTKSANLQLFGSYSCGVWGDINNDGYADLFLAEAYGIGRCHLLLNNKDGTFRDMPSDCGINFSAVVATAAFGDYNNDGKLDLFLATEYPSYDLLYLNTSHNDTISFHDVSTAAGIEGYSSTIPMQVTFIDIDHDGDQDIYAVHDGFLPSSMYRNNGDGTFTDISFQNGLYDVGVGNSMGVYWKDYDFDGWEEVYVTRIGKGGLYKRQVNGKYINIADTLGAELNGMTWGVVWEDFDNDMDDDMFMVNTFGFNGVRSLYYENNGGVFLEKSSEYNLNFPFAFNGLAYGDFNNDGYLDLVAAASDGNNKLLMNTKNKSGNWITLTLTGTTVNTMAVGVKARAVTGGKNQMRTVTAGNSFASQMSSLLHFGFGQITHIDTLEITWSAKHIQIFTDVPLNTHYRLTEGNSLLSGIESQQDHTIPFRYSLEQNYPNPFNPTTTIGYHITNSENVRLTVFDILGRVVRVPVNEVKEPGNYSLEFNASKLTSGIYYYRLQTGKYSETKRMILIR